MMDWSKFLMYLGSGTSKASIYGICAGRWKNDFYLIFWPAGDLGGLGVGRPGISEVSSSTKPDRWGAVEGRRHFFEIFAISREI